jgi:hypothetical protein
MKITDPTPDVMQVCRNGHVLTERLRSRPDQGRTHCDRCGAVTVDRCLTCGEALPGAAAVDLPPIGAPRPPQFCAACGAAFPWTDRSAVPPSVPLRQVEALWRRLPQVVRQLRTRHGDRPPFAVRDERDLEDLVRALLPLHFDDVRPVTRTPAYAAGNRTDFTLAGAGIAVTLKWVRADCGEEQIAGQIAADVAEHAALSRVRSLVVAVYDPDGRLPDPARLETACSRAVGDLRVYCLAAR